MNVVDLFSGPGGWDVAARELGLDPLGIEWDDAACKTREAAGLRTLQADVSKLEPSDFGPVDLLIASPPCQDFSLAGKRAGIDGDRGKLVAEVLRWVDALRPTFVACEQVPPVLPIWQAYAHILRCWGYSAWAGVLNAADYGVPQTRQRAILIARRDGTAACPPEPTHCKGGAPESMFGPGLEPWVSMAQALGWDEAAAVHPARGEGMIERHGPREDKPATEVAPTVISKARSWTVRTNNTTGAGYDGSERVRYERSVEEPSPTLGTRSDLWTLRNGAQRNAAVRTIDQPAPTMLSSMDNGDTRWVRDPATTIVPGRNRSSTELPNGSDANAVRVSVEEAAILQSFPPDHPWQGSRSKQFEQVGNAIPPRLARHILAALVGNASERAA